MEHGASRAVALACAPISTGGTIVTSSGRIIAIVVAAAASLAGPAGADTDPTVKPAAAPVAVAPALPATEAALPSPAPTPSPAVAPSTTPAPLVATQPVNRPEDAALPVLSPLPAQKLDAAAARAPHDPSALGGYDVLIADRGNDRLIIVNPQRQIIWQYHFQGIPPHEGADDAFFADHGKSIVTNLEHGQVILKIDIATGKTLWSYGKLGQAGAAPGLLDYPDDAYQLPNGNIIVADIRNCRILEIAPDKHIVRQAGRTDNCSGEPGTLRSPNGDRPLANGGVLVSEIQGHSLAELGPDWKPVYHFVLPILYPSDPQPTHGGNVIVAGYTRPGNIIEISPAGKELWRYRPAPGEELNRPSLAEELPNGNILATDDLNHRIVVIERKTNRILWQYGVRGMRGDQPGYLHIPDGLDIIPETQK